MQNYISLSYIGAGLAPNSQAAYDALCNSSGLLRPKVISADDRDNTEPIRKPSAIVYGLNCIKFEPPFFTIGIDLYVCCDVVFIFTFFRNACHE